MEYLVNHIKNRQDLLELPKIYKTISGLKGNELSYYLLFINKDNDLKDVLNGICEKYYGEEVSLKELSETEKESVIVIDIKLDEERFAKGIFYWEKESNFLYMITDFGKKKRKLLESFLYKMYPLIEIASLPSQQVITPIINGILLEGYKITSSMISEKKWWEKEEKIKSSLEYPTGIPIEDVLAGIKKNNAFINSLYLNILNQQGLRICKLFISRKGTLRFIDGSFDFFYESIFNKSLQIITHSYDNLKNRQQIKDKIKPIVVNFTNLSKEPKTMIKEFTHVLRDNREISLMTHHNGNPFFFADVSDIKEGSFFSVMFESQSTESRLTILPQEVSSQIALSKFIHYIFNRFGEGELVFKDG